MRHGEAHIQAAIVRAYHDRGIFIASVPNEAAGSNAIRQGQLITMGLTPGVADLFAFIPGLGVTFLEVKTTTGKQSPAQKKFEARCKTFGVGYHVVRSVEDALEVLPPFLKTVEAAQEYIARNMPT